MVPRYSSKGDDAAVYEMNDGSFIVIERDDTAQPYDRVPAPSLAKGIEMADAWQEWTNMVRESKRARVDAISGRTYYN